MFFLQADSFSKLEKLAETLIEQGTNLGLSILKALIVFLIGRYLIKLINKVIKRLLAKDTIAPAVRSFISSLVNIILLILLIISVVGALGIQTTSFAALVASAGVAIGVALSGNLSNFAGGLIILIFKPFKVGDYILAANISGTVVEIQIFHTILNTSDNIRVYVPNGTLSSGYVNNYNVERRRIEWIFRVNYGEDFDKVKTVINKLLISDSRIFSQPAPLIEINQLDTGSVAILVRVWASASDYWKVYYHINQQIYSQFNSEGIHFPIPRLAVHQTD